jgi:hypothetical protein
VRAWGGGAGAHAALLICMPLILTKPITPPHPFRPRSYPAQTADPYGRFYELNPKKACNVWRNGGSKNVIDFRPKNIKECVSPCGLGEPGQSGQPAYRKHGKYSYVYGVLSHGPAPGTCFGCERGGTKGVGKRLGEGVAAVFLYSYQPPRSVTLVLATQKTAPPHTHTPRTRANKRQLGHLLRV